MQVRQDIASPLARPTPAAMGLTVAEALPADVSAEWNGLAAGGDDRSIFASPIWHAALEETGNAGPGRSLLLGIRRRQSLVGLVPLRRTPNAIAFSGGTDLVDYHHCLCSAEHVSAVCQALVQHLTSRDDWTEAHFASLPADAPALAHLPALFRTHGCEARVEEEDVCPVIALAPTWESYLDSLSRKRRHEIRRKLRVLESAGDVRFRTAAEGVPLEQGLDVFFDLQQRAAPEKRAFWTLARRRFVRSVVPRLAQQGHVRLHALWIGSAPAAVSLNFAQGSCWYAYNSAYDPRHRALSPGFVNHALGIREAIRAGAARFDFLRGAEPYKYLFGGQDRPLRALRVSRAPRAKRVPR